MQRLAFHVLVLCLLTMSQCGSDSIVLLIHVKGLTPDVKVLKIDAMLDGKAAQQRVEYTQRLSQVVVRIPREAIGHGALSVSLFGLAADRCKLSAVRYDSRASERTPYAEVDLRLELLPSKVCTLTIDRVGSGTVSSVPAGINCGEQCAVDLPPNTKVTLTAVHTAVAEWTGDCAGTKDTCEVTMTVPRRVKVQWGAEVHPKMVLVPKGSFQMGSQPDDPDGLPDEMLHSVTVSGDFLMAETEVSQRQYRNVMGLMGRDISEFKGDELPVESVSWFDAVAYCNQLSQMAQLTPCYQVSGTDVAWKDGVKCTGYRLPTEAEWEYAARAPTGTKYAGSDSLDEVAWYWPGAGNTTHAVRTKKANGRGIYDLTGNVWEWVWDGYVDKYETLPPTDPMGSASGSQRVLRGGSWSNVSWIVRVAFRNRSAPANRSGILGLRLVRSVL